MAKKMKRLWLVLVVIVLVVVAYSVLQWTWATPAPVYVAETTGTPQTSTVEITYIANEGVLISSDGKQVLIDGLHREYEPDYATLPPADSEKIETAKAPFDKINRSRLPLSPRSFSPRINRSPLTTQPASDASLFSTSDRGGGEEFKNYQAINPRVTAATPPWKEKVAMKVPALSLRF